jgi:TolB-like protein
MKIFFTTVLFLTLATMGFSQKQAVGITPFTYLAESATAQQVYAITESVTNAFVKTKRFKIVDRSKMEALRKEKNLQSSEDFIDGSVVAQSANIGADFLISGNITSANPTRMEARNDDGSITVTYMCKMAITLKVIDVATGQVVSSETIEPKAGNALMGAMGVGSRTPEKAFNKAMKDIEDDIDKFVLINFPLTVSIAEFNGKTILIAAGTDLGVQKKDYFKVVVITTMEVEGKSLKRKKVIGKLQVSSVDDENFSTCSIKEGGKEIKAKMDAGAVVKCIASLKK